MLVAEGSDVGNRAQILTYQLSENTRSCAMENTYARHANKDGVVDEIGDGIDSLVASHASDIEILTEVQFAVVYDLTRVARDGAVCACDAAVALLCL